MSAGYATLIVELGFGVPASGTSLYLDDVTRGLLDTGTLDAGDTWTDVSQWVSAANFQTGAQRIDGPNIRYEPGTGSLTLRNEDRRFDPENAAGPYVAGGVSLVAPMMRVRFRATYTSSLGVVTSYNLWWGYADDVLIDDDSLSTSTVQIPLFDALSTFFVWERAAVGSVGAGELTGARVARILDSIGWPAADRVIAAGNTTLAATNLSGDALTELQQVADAELGELYVDATGKVIFRDRNSIVTDIRSNTSNGTFGDLIGSELPYSTAKRDRSRVSVFNDVSITRVGGSEQRVTDATSITQYLRRTYQRTDLTFQSDATALDYANMLLYQAKAAETRFSEINLSPDRQPDDLFPHAFGRLLGDRITVNRRPPGGGTLISRDSLIRGYAHSITPGVAWRTRWTLQSATRLSFFVLDSATLGTLDNNALSY